MKINDNGITREMTPEEIAEAERTYAETEAERRKLPPTDQERFGAQLTYTATMTDTLLED